ncbi:IS630 family transposase ISBs2 [bioreactor metagenome]|uniref:IS630 family transposase ISBs2 n=1 Tax=bioreactor metagenome TaxID=1076179 RepID=A0A645DJV5_9ZZZZ
MDILILDKISGHEEEIKELNRLAKAEKSVRMYKRYSVILKHFQGFTNRKIAEMENLEEHTVSAYIKSYKAKGLDGLKMKKSSGKKRKINPEQEKILVEVVTTKTPDEVGFENRKNWTIELIRQWVIKEFNITICHRGMAEVLYRLNLSYTRPTYVMAKADKEKQEKFKNDFNELKKIP